MQNVHRNTDCKLLINIDKIFCKNSIIIFLVQNTGNFEGDFFLILNLQIFLLKQGGLLLEIS